MVALLTIMQCDVTAAAAADAAIKSMSLVAGWLAVLVILISSRPYCSTTLFVHAEVNVDACTLLLSDAT